MGDGRAILKQISERKNPDVYRHEHWEGSFTDYLDIVRQTPTVTRNAFQRLYDMVVSHGSEAGPLLLPWNYRGVIEARVYPL